MTDARNELETVGLFVLLMSAAAFHWTLIAWLIAAVIVAMVVRGRVHAIWHHFHQ